MWRNPVEFYGQSGRLDLSDIDDAGGHLRGQLDPAGRQLMRLRHADGQTVHLSYCTNVHAAEDLDGILAQLDTYAVPIRARLGHRRARPGPVAGRTGRRRAGVRSAPTVRRLRAALRRARPGSGHPQRFPVRRVPAAGRQGRRLPAGLDLAGTPDLHPEPGPGAGRPAPGRRRPRLGLHPAAGLAHPVGHRPARRCRRALDTLAGELGRAGPPGPGRVRTGTRLRHREHHPGRRAAARRRHRPTSASASTWPTWPAPGRTRPRPSARLRDAGVPIVKTQVSAALATDDPIADKDVLGCLRGAALPAPDPRPTTACPPTTWTRPWTRNDGRPWRIHYHVPIHAAPVAAAAGHHRRADRRPGRAGRRTHRRLRSPGRRDVHLGCPARRSCARTPRPSWPRGSPPSSAYARDLLEKLEVTR